MLHLKEGKGYRQFEAYIANMFEYDAYIEKTTHKSPFLTHKFEFQKIAS